ncbi:MAG: hypothetical protein SCALA702_20830 [Melioribacteraceae bacterium]|nr:MAG: hypothetical protein SCALA702_20830 [Melioribacteraceae bacterium]
MLNYIWLTLIALGLLAAVSSDVSDKFSNKFHNGESVVATWSTVEGSTNQLNVTISSDQYYRTYGESLDEPLHFVATLNKGESKQTLYFRIDDTFPEVWRQIAGATGEENDISATVVSQTGNSITFINEETGFLKLKDVTNAALDYAGISVEIALGLIGIMAMWLGIMKIAEEAGIISIIARGARPITRFLFPEIPPDHPAIGAIIMNISATFLGLGNAATPFGIKAMEELDKLNPEKGTATNAMCTFLVINTASFALMPTTAIALRAASGSSDPAIIIGTTMFGSFAATVVGITTAKLLEKFPFSMIDVKSWVTGHLKFFIYSTLAAALVILGVSTGAFGFVAGFLPNINVDTLKTVIEVISVVAIPALILLFVTLGMLKRVKIYETFVEGAKEGFEIAVTIIPYLVAILVAIGIFRTGGAMDWLVWVLHPVTDFVGMPAEALPMALMRPLSGSGSLGIMAEIISVHGPDSFIGILVSTFFGSTETTFYVLAVYFGAVKIKNTRHALPAGLISDIAGILAGLFIVRLLFG